MRMNENSDELVAELLRTARNIGARQPAGEMFVTRVYLLMLMR